MIAYVLPCFLPCFFCHLHTVPFSFPILHQKIRIQKIDTNLSHRETGSLVDKLVRRILRSRKYPQARVGIENSQVPRPLHAEANRAAEEADSGTRYVDGEVVGGRQLVGFGG